MKTTLIFKPKNRFAAAMLLLALGSRVSSIWAQPTTFTYQGLVTDNGTNFTGTGQFKFALVVTTNVSRQAFAFATVAGGAVTSVNVDSGGNGYTSPPAVTFSGGGGSNAAATATVSGGAVTGYTLVNGGSGYTNPPIVRVAPPPPDLAFITFWSNDGTSVNGSEPAAAVPVGVSGGLFTVVLGDPTLPNMASVDASLFAMQPSLDLRIWFNDGVHGSAALSPVQTLTATPYAAFAIAASNIVGALSAADLTSIGNTNGGGGNFFIGLSGNSTASGSENTALGNSALANVTSGGGNSAFGAQALYWDTTGYDNTAVGYDALLNNITGHENTAVGYSALSWTTNGLYNTALGAYALQFNRNGIENTAVGYNALGNSTTGSDNTALGKNAGVSISTGSGNIAIGRGAGTTIATGSNNIDIGNSGFGDESGVIRIGGPEHTKAVFNGIYGNPIPSGSAVVCVNSSGLIGTLANGGATLAGNLAFDTSTYHNLSLSGGNSIGFLYGSFPALGDGIHLGYNYYYDAAGSGHIFNTGGGTSRISVGYADVSLWVGGVNTAPMTVRLDATTAGVCVYGTFNNCSDRNVKQDFAPVSPTDILDKVLQLPLSEWSYQTDASTRHIGPMGQDFYATFKIGTDDKHIAPIDEGGVALAAIQGLNQKLSQKDAELQELKQRLEKLEQLLGGKDRGAK